MDNWNQKAHLFCLLKKGCVYYVEEMNVDVFWLDSSRVARDKDEGRVL